MESTHVERKGEDLAKIPRGRAGSGMDAKSKVTLVVWGHHMFSFLYQPLGVVLPIPEATALGLHVIPPDYTWQCVIRNTGFIPSLGHRGQRYVR